MGALRRRIGIATRPGEARAVVEDDFHNFRVTVRHGAGVVTQAFAGAPRHPTALCPQASDRLGELVGMALNPSSGEALRHTDARQQCTHMIDLAGLAVAAAARGLARRTYDIEVTDPDDTGSRARLRRDGELVLDWAVRRGLITEPPPFAGRHVGTGFTAWAAEALEPDLAEAALVLRRGVFIAGGRGVDLDAPGRTTGPIGGCWVWQPERAAQAKRIVGSTLDFTDRPAALTLGDRGWLAFEDWD
jgi:hypothetical protein